MSYLGSIDILSGKTVGVLGTGHLGAAIAGALVRGGLPHGSIVVANRGGEASRRRAEAYGLGDRIVTPDELAARADIVMILTRPQDIAATGGLEYKHDAVMISVAAGLTRATLARIYGHEVTRAMTSSPETFDDGTAAAVFYPECGAARAIFELCGASVMPISSEDEIDAFTASICMPPITAALDLPAEAAQTALSGAVGRYPVLEPMMAWVLGTAVRMKKIEGITLEHVATKGGMTEAMADAIKAGASPQEAFDVGVARAHELSEAAARAL